jgi:hypothetical protein
VIVVDKTRKTWKHAIETALKQKGFTAKAARKTAKLTIKRSIEKESALLNQPEDYSVNWKETISLHREQCNFAARRTKTLHDTAVINKPSTMAEKIVVVPPKGKV